MAFEPINTQEELDAVLKTRLAREREKVAAEYAAKYGDYDDLKAKATAYDEAEEASKTELQKAQEEIAKLTSEKKEREEADRLSELRKKVAKEKGIPEDLIVGTDEESMAAFADRMAEFAKVQTPPAPKDPTPGSFATNTGDADSEMRSFAAALLGKE